jgi:VWFA-related protein
VLDMSASVAGDRLDHLRRASHVLVDALKKGDRAAVIGFSHFVEFGALTTELPSVVASLERMQPAGGTSLRDAAYAGLLMGETDEGRSLAIVFSDGVDTTSWLTPEAVIDTAKRSMSTVVYGVSVAGSRAAFLRQLTTDTGGSIFEVESTKNLDAVFVKVLSEFRGRYLVSYSPNGVLKGGWHRLEVRIKGRSNLAVKTRPGYLAS